MNKQGRKPVILLLLAGVLAIALMVALTLLLMPFIRRLTDPAYQAELRNWIDSLGIFGYLFIFAIQIAQIIIAFIPGEPVEILAGVMYGGFWGAVLCLFGCIVASAGAFVLSKKFGAAFAKRYYDSDNLNKLSFLKNARNLEVVVFVLFLIPGTPKDILTYVAGTTPMRVMPFLVISTFARIPSIVSSTYLGSSLWNDNWQISVVIFAFIAVTGVLGIVLKDRVIGFYKKHNSQE